ncbi:ABC transporter ATP-binding protein [Mesorhizobium sp. B2-6-5]|uniref:ABC transporter ATP-binding protein n=1 Tax=Mesorhizobium sp. B2-6-5 TaxID=2589912 RepID=UPI00112B4F16|nr:ABC transporter ATP-binding protein [Mesorhizobium sp. B2-6-5]TPJ38582.1 ABC transporter ATP-binding protein [Mesorhizobium sp. B2-6-5]
MPGNGEKPPLLEVKDLSVDFRTSTGVVNAVRNVSFTLGRERLGIVGESGSGKSTIGRTILRLHGANGLIRAQRMAFEDRDLLALSERQMRGVRGRQITMIMQDPKYSLNPVLKIGDQIAEAYRAHSNATRTEARARSIEMLGAVQINDPERVAETYPHQLSGGMGQRVMIAMMLIPNPALLIADEPTSALDVTIQMQILAILDDMVTKKGMGLIFISHDLNLVASFCDRILIMYKGRIVESCMASELHAAKHPYTQGLLGCVPDINREAEELNVLEKDPEWAR